MAKAAQTPGSVNPLSLLMSAGKLLSARNQRRAPSMQGRLLESFETVPAIDAVSTGVGTAVGVRLAADAMRLMKRAQLLRG